MVTILTQIRKNVAESLLHTISRKMTVQLGTRSKMVHTIFRLNVPLLKWTTTSHLIPFLPPQLTSRPRLWWAQRLRRRMPLGPIARGDGARAQPSLPRSHQSASPQTHWRCVWSRNPLSCRLLGQLCSWLVKSSDELFHHRDYFYLILPPSEM